MKEKVQNITITLKKSDKLTMKFLDGKILSGKVTNIKVECAEAVLLQPDDTNNIDLCGYMYHKLTQMESIHMNEHNR